MDVIMVCCSGVLLVQGSKFNADDNHNDIGFVLGLAQYETNCFTDDSL